MSSSAGASVIEPDGFSVAEYFEIESPGVRTSGTKEGALAKSAVRQLQSFSFRVVSDYLFGDPV